MIKKELVITGRDIKKDKCEDDNCSIHTVLTRDLGLKNVKVTDEYTYYGEPQKQIHNGYDLQFWIWELYLWSKKGDSGSHFPPDPVKILFDEEGDSLEIVEYMLEPLLDPTF